MTSHPNHNKSRVSGAAALLVAAVIGIAGCNNSDPTAPADSTMTVSANPQTVVVPSVGDGQAQITATIRSKNGNRLPDQEVTFSTSAGRLDPPAETPILTDTQGQAISTLFTRTSASITARSGGTSGMTQIQTSSCDLDQFLLTVQPQDLTSCNDMLTLEATIEDVNGAPCEGVRVIFAQDPNDKLKGTFSPSSQISSDAAGLAGVTWRANQSQCDPGCTNTGPNGGDCGPLNFTAGDITHTFDSAPAQVTDSIH